MKLIICDFDDTIVDYTTAHKLALDAAFESICLPMELLKKEHSLAKKYLYETFPNMFVRHDKLLQFKIMFERLGVSDPMKVYDAYLVYEKEYLEKIAYRPGMKQFIEESRVPIVVMTNNTLEIQIKVIKKLDMKVAEIFTSNEFFYEKPDSVSLGHILEKYNVEPSEALVIGDSQSDADWAKCMNVPYKLV